MLASGKPKEALGPLLHSIAYARRSPVAWLRVGEAAVACFASLRAPVRARHFGNYAVLPQLQAMDAEANVAVGSLLQGLPDSVSPSTPILQLALSCLANARSLTSIAASMPSSGPSSSSSPSSPDPRLLESILLNLAFVHMALGHYAQVVSTADQLPAQSSPVGLLLGHMYAACALFMSGRPGSNARLQSAVDRMSSCQNVNALVALRINFAVAYLSAGNAERALAVLQGVIEPARQDPVTHAAAVLVVAHAALLKGDRPQAIEALQRGGLL